MKLILITSIFLVIFYIYWSNKEKEINLNYLKEELQNKEEQKFNWKIISPIIWDNMLIQLIEN